MGYEVFISHSTEDKAYANAICHKLEEERIGCWIAPRDINPGEEWETAINKAIEITKVLVLIYSEHSNTSKYVNKEITLAVQKDCIIIPFRIDDSKMNEKMEFNLCNCHWIDAIPYKDKKIDELVASVRRTLGISSGYKIVKNDSNFEKCTATTSNKVKKGLFSKLFGGGDRKTYIEDDTYDKKEKKKETYETIEFGSYPQREIRDSELTPAIVMAEYDENGEAVVNGERYKRITKNDATYVCEKDSDLFSNHYDWEDRKYLYFIFEPIKWRVLNKDNNDWLLLSEYALDDKMYNRDFKDVTWETCSLRKWLNEDFINKAFTQREQVFIKKKQICNPDNKEYNTKGGNDTIDKVFLLSIDEVENEQYGFTDADSRAAKCTDYTRAMGAYSSEKGGGSWWWLRSPGEYSYDAANVLYLGWVYRAGDYVDLLSDSIRPALIFNLSSDI